MGLLNLFKNAEPTLLALPAGSFTVDGTGEILASTVASSYPNEQLRKVAQRVLQAFKSADAAGLPLDELNIEYPSIKITARELRGGAVVFLVPVSAGAPKNLN